MTNELCGRILNSVEAIERFMKKVIRPPGDKCWTWTGSKSGSGYGQFWNGSRNIPAHWFLLDKHPENGSEACHHCDNKLCVRPSHIFIGTRSENMMDAVRKGRHKGFDSKSASRTAKKRRRFYGEDNATSKLSLEDAIRCKQCPKTRGSASRLAEELGVSLTVVCGIRSGHRWKQIRQRAEALVKVIEEERK